MKQYYQLKRRRSNPPLALSVSQINPKTNLNTRSLNIKQSNNSNKNVSNYPPNKYSLFFPLKIDLQKMPQNRDNDQVSRFQSISQSIVESSSKTKLIKESQFSNHSGLIQYYSNNVFNPNFPSKKFAKRNKKQQAQIYGSLQRQKQCLNKSQFLNEFPLTQSNRFQRRSSSIIQNMNMVTRPHAKKKSRNMGMLIKIKKNNLNQLAKSTVEVQHIEKLKTSQSCFQQLSPANKNKWSIRPNSHCMSLKNGKKRVSSSLEVKGQHLSSIDPWQFQFQKVKNLADMEIIIKI